MAQVDSNAVSSPVRSDLPRNRWVLIVVSILVGAALASIWSYHFVDSVIGDNVANTLLGYDAKEVPLAGLVSGTVFAFVSGLAGTFTACNIAAFGAIAPMSGSSGGASEEAGRSTVRISQTLRAVGWLALGMGIVSASYGAIGVMIGDGLPQLAESSGEGISPRLMQASVVFGIVGLAFTYLGLAALRVVPDPFTRLSVRFPNARLVAIGALIGGFLIGRPFPLFRVMFSYAVEVGNPLYGAGVFLLQSLGNITVVTLLFLLLVHGTRGRFVGWLTAKPSRITVITAVAFLVVGSFTFLYWDVRLPALHGYGWYPVVDW
ncbi:hypothetical protein [Salinactinospora qingdaonensis]|uniref:Cytochrome C biogenesis protein transmembrane region n=1 Tax=Salinactinospora qingdaonensis TaxID=702744 RepID=A0ABP7FU59_9ACTN